MSSPGLTYDMLTLGSSRLCTSSSFRPTSWLPFTPGTPTAFHTGHFPTLNAYPPSPTIPGASSNMGGYTTNNGLLSPQMQTYPGFYSPGQQQNQGTQMDQNSSKLRPSRTYNSPLPSPESICCQRPWRSDLSNGVSRECSF